MNSWCKIISIKETTHCRGHLQGLWKICIWIDCNDKNITILSLSQTGKSIASSVSVTLSCWLRTSSPIALECIDTPAVKKHLSVPKPKGQGYYLYNNKNFFKKLLWLPKLKGIISKTISVKKKKISSQV